MRATLRFLFLLVFLVGCAGDDDEEIECSLEENALLDSYYSPQFLIRLVDASGKIFLKTEVLIQRLLRYNQIRGILILFIYPKLKMQHLIL